MPADASLRDTIQLQQCVKVNYKLKLYCRAMDDASDFFLN